MPYKWKNRLLWVALAAILVFPFANECIDGDSAPGDASNAMGWR